MGDAQKFLQFYRGFCPCASILFCLWLCLTCLTRAKECYGARVGEVSDSVLRATKLKVAQSLSRDLRDWSRSGVSLSGWCRVGSWGPEIKKIMRKTLFLEG